MIEEIKRLLIERYDLSSEIHTRHNNIYEGKSIVLIESVITGELKLKPRRR
jgi:hypothetical protein